MEVVLLTHHISNKLLAKVTQDGKAWDRASDTMKGDKDILFASVKQLGAAVDENMTMKELWLAKVV